MTPALIIAAAVLALVIAAALLPARVKLSGALSGAFARGSARVGLIYGFLGVTVRFSAYKNAAGRYEARVWLPGRPEKIYTLPLPNELPGVILKELIKRGGGKSARAREARPRESDRGASRFARIIGLLTRNKDKRGKKGGFAPRLARALLRSARVKALRLRGTIGTGNAAETALLTGTIAGAISALLAPVMKAPPDIAIKPDFAREALNLELACIADVSPGKSTIKSIRI